MLRMVRMGIASALLVLSAGSAMAEPAVKVAATGAPGLFSEPVVMRGSLGQAQVQVNLRPKTEFEGGVEGEYFVFGASSRKILLAGETEDENIFIEESENGTDVSGQWEGSISGDHFKGEWTSADGSVHKPFDLKVLTLSGVTKIPAPTQPAPSEPPAPSAPTAPPARP